MFTILLNFCIVQHKANTANYTKNHLRPIYQKVLFASANLSNIFPPSYMQKEQTLPLTSMATTDTHFDYIQSAIYQW